MMDGKKHTLGTGELCLITVMEEVGLLMPKKSTIVTEIAICVSKGMDERFWMDTDVLGPEMDNRIESRAGLLLFHVYLAGRTR
jgi:hypothetical protein